MATRFYFHDAAINTPVGIPTGEQSALAPVQTATGGAQLRSMNTILGLAQTSVVLTCQANTNAQQSLLRRFISPPLAAQTFPATTFTFSIALAQSNTSSAFAVSFVAYFWRPSSGTMVGALLNDVATLGSTGNPGTTETVVTATWGSVGTRTLVDGDVLVCEVWRNAAVQTMGTAYTNTFYYNGTTEASITNCASYINSATTLATLSDSHLEHHRGRDDTAALNSATFAQALDGNWSQKVDTPFRVRFKLVERGGASWAMNGSSVACQFRLNAGAWTNVGAATAVKYALSAQFADGDATTEVLTANGFTFVGGKGVETGASTALPNLSGQTTEVEFALSIDSTQVAHLDTIDLRVFDGTRPAYFDDFPTLTVVEFTFPFTDAWPSAQSPGVWANWTLTPFTPGSNSNAFPSQAGTGVIRSSGTSGAGGGQATPAYADTPVDSGVLLTYTPGSLTSSADTLCVSLRGDDWQTQTVTDDFLRPLDGYSIYLQPGVAPSFRSTVSGTVSTPSTTGSTGTPVAGEQWKLRMEASGSVLRARTWKATDPEPSTWLTMAQTATQLSGKLMVAAYLSGGSAGLDFTLDDLSWYLPSFSVVVYEDAYATSPATRNLTQRTVKAGDVVAVVVQSEDFTAFNPSSLTKIAGTATIGTITKQQDAGSTSHCGNVLWTFPVTGDGTLTFSVTFAGGGTSRRSTVLTFVATGSGGVGATGKTTTSTTTITTSLTTAADSFVAAAAADWSAAGGASTILTPVGYVLDLHETDGVNDATGAGTVMSSRAGHWTNAGPAGTAAWGVSTPTSAAYNLVAFELLAPAGALSGGAALSVTAASTTAGNVATSSTASLAATATLTAAGTVTGAGFTGTASLAVTAASTTAGLALEDAALAATAARTATGNVATSTTAALAATAARTATGNIAATGTASLAATAARTAAGLALEDAALAATATLSATGTVSAGLSSGATLAATAATSAAGTAVASTGAALAATATTSLTTTATGSATRATTAATSAAGALAATGSATLSATASLSAGGLASGAAALAATAARTAAGNAAVAGASTLTATAALAASGTASATGSASLAASATTAAAGTVASTASLSATATITAAGAVSAASAASLATTATLTAAGSSSGGTAASLSATAALTAAGTAAVTTSAALSASAALAAAGAALASSTASRSATAALTAAGQTASSSALSATAAITASGTVTGAASAPATAAISAAGQVSTTSSAQLAVSAAQASSGSATGAASVATTAARTAVGSTNLASSAPLAASASVTAAGTSSTPGGASVTATAALTATGTVSTSSGASVAVTAAVTTGGTAAAGAGIAATAALTAAGSTPFTRSSSVAVTATTSAQGQVGQGALRPLTVALGAAGRASGDTARVTTATIVATGKVGVSGQASLTVTATVFVSPAAPPPPVIVAEVTGAAVGMSLSGSSPGVVILSGVSAPGVVVLRVGGPGVEAVLGAGGASAPALSVKSGSPPAIMGTTTKGPAMAGVTTTGPGLLTVTATGPGV